LQRRGLLPLLHGREQRGLVSAGFTQLLLELVSIDLGRLLLQPQLGDALAQRAQVLLAAQPRFLEGAQLRGDLLLPVARPGEALLPGDPDFQAFLKLGSQRLVVDLLQLALEVLQVLVGLANLLMYNIK
jgi:hypothetical protein